MTQEQPDTSPWSSLDASASWWPTVFGAMLLGWSWWEASGSAVLDDQTGWGVIAVVGVGSSCLGQVAWLRAGRRSVSVRGARLLAHAETIAAPRDMVSRVAAGAPVLANSADPLVSYPDAKRYHRPDCLLTRGKATTDWVPGTVTQPCEMCQP